MDDLAMISLLVSLVVVLTASFTAGIVLLCLGED